ncbi:MAG: hypothetical protein Q8S00_04460 [Deltaproteobacteria bacterium]|nr:hypothetical protein [Deltaproteobacteria bacterium]
MKKQDNGGEITAVILGSWQLFNKNLEQCEGRANDIFGVKPVPSVQLAQRHLSPACSNRSKRLTVSLRSKRHRRGRFKIQENSDAVGRFHVSAIPETSKMF